MCCPASAARWWICGEELQSESAGNVLSRCARKNACWNEDASPIGGALVYAALGLFLHLSRKPVPKPAPSDKTRGNRWQSGSDGESDCPRGSDCPFLRHHRGAKDT
jgi:hypothetical protein